MPCHNRAHDLCHVLKAYDEQTVEHVFKVIAIDDGSTDNTYEILSSYKPTRYKLQTSRLDNNEGPATARNIGIELVDTPLMVIVGDDILPDKNFVLNHLVAHSYYPNGEFAILGRVTWPRDLPCNTLMHHIDGKGAQQFSYHYLENGQEYDFRHFYTSNISLKSRFLKQLDKWFDTDFRYAAFEDAELGYRLSRKGLRIIYDEQPLGFHYHYHTIHTFSLRQYRCGLMANVLIKKHPELARLARVDKVKSLISLGLLYRLSSTTSKLPGIANWIEEQVLHLLSAYEWQSHQLLDGLYIQVLEYFWRKGIIDGAFENSPLLDDIRNAYTIRALGSILSQFLPKASEQKIPVPIGDMHHIKQKLSPVNSPLIKYSSLAWPIAKKVLVKS